MSDLDIARNCCVARMLPEKSSSCRNERSVRGGKV